MTAPSEHLASSDITNPQQTGISGALVGRDRDLDAVVSAATTPPSVVIVEGEAGIGKTRLVQELRDHPSMAGRRLVTGSCRAITEPFPLGPVVDAVRGLSDDLRPESLSPVAGALRPLVPELADVLPPRPEPLASAVAERHQVFRAVHAVLAALDPLTVVLEDLHWADELTVDLLRYLIGDLPAGLSLVLTMRAEDAGTDVRALTARLPPSARAHVALQPLDVGQTGDLAASLLQTDRVADGVAGYMRERTGGLPFAVEEVTALLRERGVVGDRAGRVTPVALDGLGVPVAVRDHVLERAGLLPAAARALVDVVAVWQSPVPEALVAQVAGQPPDAVATGLSDAIQSGLLVDQNGDVGFRHTLAAQAIYDGLPGPRRRELHGRVADALQSAGSGATGQLALHLFGAGRLAEWAVTAEQAADRASAAEQDDEAARMLEAVLRHAPVDAATELRLAVKLGRAARKTRRARHIDDLLARALELDPPDELRGELQFLLGATLDFHDVDRDRSRALFAAAAANSDDRPEITAWALVALELRNSPRAAYAERHRTLSDVLALIPRVNDPDTRMNLLSQVAGMQVTRGDPRWRQTAAWIDEPAGGQPTDAGAVGTYESIAQAACFAGHHRDAERLIRVVLSATDPTRDEQEELHHRGAVALIDYCRGRWDRAADTVPKLLRHLAQHPRAMYTLYLVAGDLALATGDLEQAGQWYATLDAKAEGGDGADLVPMLVASQIRFAHARGDDAGALAIAERHLARLETEMLWPATYRCLPWLAAAMVRGGRVDQAATLGPRYAERLRGRDTPLGPAALAFADGFVRAGSGASTDAAESFLSAARRYDELESPFDAALARESAAESLARRGAAGSVEEPLRAAMATYERLGASRDHARAARVARRLGVSVPARHRGGPKGYGDELTPREREVAELAAAGRTNRQIAEQLFVSAETVKKHMQAVMRKLDVPSRAGLGRRLPLRRPE